MHGGCAEERVWILDVSAVSVTTYVHMCRVFSNARLSTATLRVRMTEESAAEPGPDEEDSDWPNAVHG